MGEMGMGDMGMGMLGMGMLMLWGAPRTHRV